MSLTTSGAIPITRVDQAGLGLRRDTADTWPGICQDRVGFLRVSEANEQVSPSVYRWKPERLEGPRPPAGKGKGVWGRYPIPWLDMDGAEGASI